MTDESVKRSTHPEPLRLIVGREVLNRACRLAEVDVETVLGPSRKHVIVLVRWCVAAVLMEDHGWSPMWVADLLRQDHTSIYHGRTALVKSRRVDHQAQFLYHALKGGREAEEGDRALNMVRTAERVAAAMSVAYEQHEQLLESMLAAAREQRRQVSQMGSMASALRLVFEERDGYRTSRAAS